MRAFCYHVPVPPSHSRIDYADVRMDQGAFDYDALLDQWKKAAEKFGAEWYLHRGYPGLTDTAAPMYERVREMKKYVSGPWFDQPTVFLDSDAFLNADIRHIFDGDFDIGVTYRHNFGMALNEGVIFANNRNPDAVRSFFRAYLAKYDELCADPRVLEQYNGNIKRWRGGQLSLNAVANPLGLPSALDVRECAGARVAYFPCWKWNFPVDRVDATELDTKAVLHLKGQRKKLLDELKAYQEGRK